MMRRALLITYLLAVIVPAIEVWAAGQITEPVLRIETGMHTAMIKKVATDAAGQWMVTASDDKTVRVWETSTGRLLKVIRPPIDKGHEGKLYTVAISPDGSIIACGGWTGWDWDGSASIYLFDRASGKLLKRVSGFPDIIKSLAYSPDGNYLAVTLGAGKGLFVLRTSTYQPAIADKDYDDDSYGIAFDREGRLVTSSWDGYVRLYDREFRLVAKRKMPDGMKPYAVQPINAVLPPVATILSPVDGIVAESAEMTVRFTVRSPANEPVTGVKVLVDGRPALVLTADKVTAGAEIPQEVKVLLPERDCTISVIAENRHAAGEPANVRIARQGDEQREEFTFQPKLYVLAIGVGAYKDKELSLDFAAKDAKDFAAVMERQKGGLYRDVAVRVLTDAPAGTPSSTALNGCNGRRPARMWPWSSCPATESPTLTEFIITCPSIQRRRS